MRILISLALWLLGTGAAQAAWYRAESPSFIVFAEGSEADLRRKVAVLEDYSHLLRLLMRTETPASPNKLHIYLVRGAKDLMTVRRLPPEARGAYITSVDGMLAVADTSADPGNPVSILFHEYAHHFMMQYHGRVYPPWFVEGFAEYMMTARFTERSIEIGHMSPLRASALSSTRRWLPLEDVLFWNERSSRSLGQFYAQSWLLTHYLLSDPDRSKALGSYISALGSSDDPKQAFQSSFQIPPHQLQKALERYAFNGLTARRVPRASIAASPGIKVERMPASADRLMLFKAALQIGLRDNGLTLAAIRREAPLHKDEFARRVLAQAEATYGDGQVADRLLDELLAASPNDGELIYYRGMRYLAASKGAEPRERVALMRQARTWFTQAYKINPSHFQSLYRFVQTFSEQQNLVSANNLEVLLLAHSLAPQIGDIRLNAARMLVAMGDFEHAETLLMPLVGTAHEGPLSAPARALLSKARARIKEGVEFNFDP